MPIDGMRGETFSIDTGSGPVLFRANRPANPCAWMDVELAPGAHRALLRRGGMRCTPLTDGEKAEIERTSAAAEVEEARLDAEIDTVTCDASVGEMPFTARAGERPLIGPVGGPFPPYAPMLGTLEADAKWTF